MFEPAGHTPLREIAMTHFRQAADKPAIAARGLVLLSEAGALREAQTGIVRQVRTGSDSIAAGVAQAAGGNADLDHRTEPQAAPHPKTAAAMERVDAAAQGHTKGVRRARRLAQGAGVVATRARWPLATSLP
jgi:methyl-accepting chemotaxis protein